MYKRQPAHDAPHLAALDALRGIAIVLVVVGHYLTDRVVGGTFGEILRPCAVGGVTLFFILSGFLIGRNLSRGMSPIGYALRRIDVYKRQTLTNSCLTRTSSN